LSVPLIPFNVVVAIGVLSLALKQLFNTSGTSYPIRRLLTVILSTVAVVSVATLIFEFTDVLRYSLSGYYVLAAVSKIGLLYGGGFGRSAVKPFYFVHDLIVSHVIFAVLHVAAALQIVNTVQTWLLYNSALGSNVVIDDILRFSRKSQEKAGAESEELEVQVTELRKLVLKQEVDLEQLGRGGGASEPSGTGGMKSNASTDAIHTTIEPPKAKPSAPTAPPPPPPRVHSMTSMDIWGQLTIGQELGGIDDGMGGGQQTPTSPVRTDSNFAQPTKLPPRR